VKSSMMQEREKIIRECEKLCRDVVNRRACLQKCLKSKGFDDEEARDAI